MKYQVMLMPHTGDTINPKPGRKVSLSTPDLALDFGTGFAQRLHGNYGPWIEVVVINCATRESVRAAMVGR